MGRLGHSADDLPAYLPEPEVRLGALREASAFEPATRSETSPPARQSAPPDIAPPSVDVPMRWSLVVQAPLEPSMVLHSFQQGEGLNRRMQRLHDEQIGTFGLNAFDDVSLPSQAAVSHSSTRQSSSRIAPHCARSIGATSWRVRIGSVFVMADIDEQRLTRGSHTGANDEVLLSMRQRRVGRRPRWRLRRAWGHGGLSALGNAGALAGVHPCSLRIHPRASSARWNASRSSTRRVIRAGRVEPSTGRCVGMTPLSAARMCSRFPAALRVLGQMQRVCAAK